MIEAGGELPRFVHSSAAASPTSLGRRARPDARVWDTSRRVLPSSTTITSYERPVSARLVPRAASSGRTLSCSLNTGTTTESATSRSSVDDGGSQMRFLGGTLHRGACDSRSMRIVAVGMATVSTVTRGQSPTTSDDTNILGTVEAQSLLGGLAYFDYQRRICADVVIPWVERRIRLEGLDVGDFGAHEGGMVAALRDSGRVRSTVGLELRADIVRSYSFVGDSRFPPPPVSEWPIRRCGGGGGGAESGCG